MMCRRPEAVAAIRHVAGALASAWACTLKGDDSMTHNYRISRRTALAIGATGGLSLAAILAACGAPQAPSKPAEPTKPAAPAATTAPAAKPAEAAKPTEAPKPAAGATAAPAAKPDAAA